MFDKIVNDVVGFTGVNALIDALTNGTGSAVITVGKGTEIELSGLDSFYALSFLSPSGFDLQNTLSLGECSSSSCNPLLITVQSGSSAEHFHLPVGGKAGSPLSRSLSALLSSFKISISLSNVNLYLDLLVKVSLGALANLTFGQLGTTGCLASAVNELAVEDIALDLSQATFSLDNMGIYLNITSAVNKLLSALTRESK
eukprot:gene43304-54251_t